MNSGMRRLVAGIRSMARALFLSASGEEDMVSIYGPDGGRPLTRQDRMDKLIFHFYDEAGYTRYILNMYNTGHIPEAIWRLRDDFQDKNKYDKMTASSLKKMIENSLNYFWMQKETVGRTRKDVRNENGFTVGRVIDSDFDYYMWELLRKNTGETYAWGSKGSTEITLGEPMPRNLFTKSLAPKNQPLSKFTLYFYDEKDQKGNNTCMSHEKWRDLSAIPIPSLKERGTAEAKYLFKFLNEALDETLDSLLEASDSYSPKAVDPEEYPIHVIDANFKYESYQMTRDEKNFCHANKSDKYCKIG